MAMALGVGPTGAGSIAPVGMLWDTRGCASLRRVPIAYVHALVLFRSYLLVTATQGAMACSPVTPARDGTGHAARASGRARRVRVGQVAGSATVTLQRARF